MRKSQWFVLGFAFLLLMNWFIHQDLTYERLCGVAGAPLEQYTAEKWLEKGSEPVSRVELWCINTEIFDPFIYLFGVLWIVCWINGGLEWWVDRKKK